MLSGKQCSALILGFFAAFFVWQLSLKNNLKTASLAATQSYFDAQLQYRHYQHFMSNQQKKLQLTRGKYSKDLTKKNLSLLLTNKKELQKKTKKNSIVYEDNNYFSEKLALLIADYNQQALFFNQEKNKAPFKWIARYYKLRDKLLLNYENIPSISI